MEQQAAVAEIVADDIVWLRLVQGASPQQGAFPIVPTALGTVITVGASTDCDWTVRAAGVAPQAFSVMLLAGSVFMRAAEGASVFVDGERIGFSWCRVEPGARIDVGFLRIEVRETLPVAIPVAPPAQPEPEPSVVLDMEQERPTLTNVESLRDEQEPAVERPSLASWASRVSGGFYAASVLGDTRARSDSWLEANKWLLTGGLGACALAGWLVVLAYL